MEMTIQSEARGPVVLAVDDEPAVLKFEKSILEDEGFRVVTAATGRDAIDAAMNVHPDLILLDIVLPDMDGTVVCQRIRAFWQVPIIEVSGRRTSSSDRALGLDQGADDYVVKPYVPAVLVARVKAALRRSR